MGPRCWDGVGLEYKPMARIRKMLQLAKAVSDSFMASVFEKFSIVLPEKTFFFFNWPESGCFTTVSLLIRMREYYNNCASHS